MQPQATYAPLTANMIYDPKSKFAGVASPLFDAAGNAFTAAINGEVDPADSGGRDEGRRSTTLSSGVRQTAGRRQHGRRPVRTSAGMRAGNAEEQTERDLRRGRSGRSVCRHLWLAFHLSDHPDGAAELHQRAADRRTATGSASTTTPELFGDRVFHTAVWNTAYFVLLTVAPGTAVALGIALMVSRLRGWMQSLILAAFFLPFVLPVTVVYLIWDWMLNVQFGILQYVIDADHRRSR